MTSHSYPSAWTRNENRRLKAYRNSLEKYRIETYNFLIYEWDIIVARWKISEWVAEYRESRTERMHTDVLMKSAGIISNNKSSEAGQYIFCRYVDEKYADMLPDWVFKQPVLLGFWQLDPRDHQQTCLLIDGAHRIYEASRLAITTLPVITLSYDEMKAILVKRG